MLLQAKQMHKMTSISLKMLRVVILSENSCHFAQTYLQLPLQQLGAGNVYLSAGQH